MTDCKWTGDCQYLPKFELFTWTCLIHANDKPRSDLTKEPLEPQRRNRSGSGVLNCKTEIISFWTKSY